MKICFKCGEQKELNEFYRHKSMPDGHLNKCKECTKISARENYRKNIEYYKEYEKKRALLPHRVFARKIYAESSNGIIAGNRAKHKWASYHPIQKAANIMVSNAVRDGRLNKPCKCSICGDENKRLEGHHDDYAHPLVVRWLCRKCHFTWHEHNMPLNGD